MISHCSECPLFKESKRTPSAGTCQRFKDVVLRQDVPCDDQAEFVEQYNTPVRVNDHQFILHGQVWNIA